MSWDINKVIEVGRLTKDAELKYTPSGTAVMVFFIAIGGKTVQGQPQKVSFFKVVAWGKLAENLSQYLKKGNQIIVEGHLEQNVFTTKNEPDKKHYETQIVADKIQMIGGKREQQADNPPDMHDDSFMDNPENDRDNGNFSQ